MGWQNTIELKKVCFHDNCATFLSRVFTPQSDTRHTSLVTSQPLMFSTRSKVNDCQCQPASRSVGNAWNQTEMTKSDKLAAGSRTKTEACSTESENTCGCMLCWPVVPSFCSWLPQITTSGHDRIPSLKLEWTISIPVPMRATFPWSSFLKKEGIYTKRGTNQQNIQQSTWFLRS